MGFALVKVSNFIPVHWGILVLAPIIAYRYVTGKRAHVLQRKLIHVEIRLHISSLDASCFISYDCGS